MRGETRSFSIYYSFSFFYVLFFSFFFPETERPERERERGKLIEGERNREGDRRERERTRMNLVTIRSSLGRHRGSRGPDGPRRIRNPEPSRNPTLRRDPKAQFQSVPVAIFGRFLVGRLRWNVGHDFQ
jgi:hypothetical protein